jgi:hypothetical protein
MSNVPDFLLLSLKLERETGFDSIPTIEEMYEQVDENTQEYYKDDIGALICPTPQCDSTRHTAEAMWRHVHFTNDGLHSYSFGVGSPNELDIKKDYTPDPEEIITARKHKEPWTKWVKDLT